MSSCNCGFLTCIHVSKEASQVVWYSHLFQNFPQFTVIHLVKGFGIVNKAEIDVFLELSCFFDDPVDVGNLISGSSALSKTSLNIMWTETNRPTQIKTYYKVSIVINTLHFFIPSKIVFYFVILFLYVDIHYYKCLKILKQQLNSSSHTYCTLYHVIYWNKHLLFALWRPIVCKFTNHSGQ